ncbi:MAG: hypothetical protein JXA06_06100 [Bacteroidetes bacterium]|nr:hypothetical protein [Bacteroidota bacterium]
MKKITFSCSAMLMLIVLGLSNYSCNDNETTAPENNKRTLETGTFTDNRDNKIYNWVKIGNQTWMSENLNYDAGTGSWVYSEAAYNDEAANATAYGRLYDWETACNVCPNGWHLPSDIEWTELTNFLESNSYGYEGSGNDIAKSMAAASGWTGIDSAGTVGNDQASNNSSGFSALPGGGRVYGTCSTLRFSGYWWSSTEFDSNDAYCRFMHANFKEVLRNHYNKSYGLSIRCIKD